MRGWRTQSVEVRIPIATGEMLVNASCRESIPFFLTCNFTCKKSVLAVFARTSAVLSAL
ncbi:MAG: hypothetical protein JWN45_3539 [Acidobacteriaceae bacterium]|nr:hypothetical protein [Acidobacteriaceae bacterium]